MTLYDKKRLEPHQRNWTKSEKLEKLRAQLSRANDQINKMIEDGATARDVDRVNRRKITIMKELSAWEKM